MFVIPILEDLPIQSLDYTDLLADSNFDSNFDSNKILILTWHEWISNFGY